MIKLVLVYVTFFLFTATNVKVDVTSAGLSVLHKSKWKGQTLCIEMAKESFLHRYSPCNELTYIWINATNFF